MNLSRGHVLIVKVSYFYDFLDFVEVWQELEFWKVLNGRKIEHDRAEFIEEIYQITVRFLDDPLNGEVIQSD